VEIFSLETPIITEYPKELYPGTPLLVKGSAFPEATVKVFLQNDKTGETTGQSKADKDGYWSYIDLSIKKSGTYKLFVQAVDDSGGKSQPSAKVTILVTKPVFIRIGDLSITCFAMSILTLLLFIFGFSIMIFAWRRKKKKIRREVSEAEEALKKAFKELKKKIEEQAAKLDGKKGLNSVEQEIADNLKEALKISEAYISEELRDIDDELR
jgi:cbb3-type cytochrome oxidase subunit 3